MEVFVDVRCVKLRYAPFHPHLPSQTLPVKAERCSGIFRELNSFSALGVREKAEAVRTYSLYQYHAHAWHTILGRSAESGRVGIVGLALLSLHQPGIEQ